MFHLCVVESNLYTEHEINMKFLIFYLFYFSSEFHVRCPPSYHNYLGASNYKHTMFKLRNVSLPPAGGKLSLYLQDEYSDFLPYPNHSPGHQLASL